MRLSNSSKITKIISVPTVLYDFIFYNLKWSAAVRAFTSAPCALISETERIRAAESHSDKVNVKLHHAV